MNTALISIVILVPFAVAALLAVVPGRAIRRALVLATGVTLSVASVLLLREGSFQGTPHGLFGVEWDAIVRVVDFLLLGAMLLIGLKLRSWLVSVLVVLQGALLGWFEYSVVDHHREVIALAGDNLSLVMVAVVSVVGSIIVAFALPYMDEHEHHLKLKKSRQPRFFVVMVAFLGAMNGLVLANNLLWLYFFFEVTTLCSFLLIGHDATADAKVSAKRALWMNSVGGLAFAGGIVLSYLNGPGLSLRDILMAGPASGPLLLAIGLIVVAGFTKSAQVPMQAWLLGAMVAPTPVSALLHSSTMVKAGVYLVLRLAPAYAGTRVGTCIALAGGVSFVVCAAMAVSQSNGKKILAYSTISNLGLIIACAGLATPKAMTAALLLIVFHAVSKALLFLCVGTIEQAIGSRDIEDMRGLVARFPRTALVTVVGILTMMLPPFGVLLSKWIAIEAAVGNPFLVLMLAVGSALGVVVYARWAGLLLSAPFGSQRRDAESQPILLSGALVLLACLAVVLPLGLPLFHQRLIAPLFQSASAPFQVGILGSQSGVLETYPLYFSLGVVLLAALWIANRSIKVRMLPAYMSGVPGDAAATTFLGPGQVPVRVQSSNFYLTNVFGEQRLTRWVNLGAALLIALMLGVALQ
jgi:ech hydrogenase subunit A